MEDMGTFIFGMFAIVRENRIPHTHVVYLQRHSERFTDRGIQHLLWYCLEIYFGIVFRICCGCDENRAMRQ